MDSINIRNVGISLIVLALIVAAAFAVLKRGAPSGPAAAESHVLPGSVTPSGDYKYVEDQPYYTIAATYPAKTALQGDADVKARHTIEQALSDRIAQFKQNGGFANLTPGDIEMQGLGPERKYALNLEYKAYSGAGYVSYAYTIYEDTLGAHPNAYYLTLVFDKNGNEIALKNLFKNGSDYLARIAGDATVQVKAELTRRLGADPGESFFDEGTAPKDENFENFVIDGDTMVFLFPPYQVAAYAAGAFQARVPLSELSDIRFK